MSMENVSAAKKNYMFENADMLNGKWLNEISVMMIDALNKQRNFSFGIYNNYINTYMDALKNVWNPALNYAFANYRNGDALKNIFNTLNNYNNMINPFMLSLDKVIKQLTDYNQQVMDNLNKNIFLTENGRNNFVEAYMKLIESRMDALKNVIETYLNVRKQQINFTMEATKKVQDRINQEFDLILNAQEEFWATYMKSNRNDKAQRKQVSITELHHHNGNGHKKVRV